MRMTPRHLLVIAIGVAACSLLGPIENRVVGRVELRNPGENPIVVPDSAPAGQAFHVTVLTAGGGCTRQGDTEVVTDGNTTIVTPYDIEIIHRDDTVCPSYLDHYEHVARVEMPVRGEGVVVIRARDFASDTAIELRHTVEIF